MIRPLVRALLVIRPGAQWTLRGDTIADLIWLDLKQSAPSEDEVTAAIAALPPLPSYVMTSVLLGRLTDAEYTAIMQASSAGLAAGNGQLNRWLDMARVALTGVDLNDPATITAKAALVSMGLLTQDRADVIFSL